MSFSNCNPSPFMLNQHGLDPCSTAQMVDRVCFLDCQSWFCVVWMNGVHIHNPDRYDIYDAVPSKSLYPECYNSEFLHLVSRTHTLLCMSYVDHPAMQFMGELQPPKRLFGLRGGEKLHKVRHLFKLKPLFAYTPLSWMTWNASCGNYPSST